jgi:hypothetical protein
MDSGPLGKPASWDHGCGGPAPARQRRARGAVKLDADWGAKKP